MAMTRSTNFEITEQLAMLLFIGLEDKFDEFLLMRQIALCKIIMATQNELRGSLLSTTSMALRHR